MNQLVITPSCEIDNLINVIAQRTGKTYSEVEKQAQDEYKTTTNTYFDVRWPDKNDGWFTKAVQDLLKEMNMQGIYVQHLYKP
jgi:hypothetical protein